ncbi:MAG TPA: hypothetical protein EYH03_04780, partial [Chromatiales bacterium]|nr:hypothetical protein [Chromatiales bacterium]
HRLSGAVPRLINTISERALMGAYAEQKKEVDSRIVRRAAAEVKGGKKRGWMPWAAAGATALLLIASATLWNFSQSPNKPSITSPPQAINDRNHETRADQAASETTSNASTVQSIDNNDAQAAAETGPPSLTAESETAEPAATPFSQLLVTGALSTDSNTSFTTLFRYWDADYNALSGQTACERAAAAGLSCIFGRGTWNNLKLFNRPAVIELVDPLGRRHHITLNHLDEKNVTLDIGGIPRTLSRDELEPLWFGAYLLLWRPPPIQHNVLRIGMKGSDVVWLRNQLERALEMPDPNPKRSFFDTELAERVKQFQSAQGLPADGVVGRQTLISLNGAVADPAIPLLSRPPILDQRLLGRAPK